MSEVTISVLDLVTTSTIGLPWMIEKRLHESGFRIEAANTLLDYPSTLEKRIGRPFVYTHDLEGNLSIWQEPSK